MGAEDVTRLAVRSGEGPASGKLVGVLPLYRVRSRMFGDFLVSVPFLNGGGPIATGLGAERALLDASAALRVELGADFVELRAFGSREGWRERTDKVSMVLGLPTSFETLEEDLGAKVRAQARRGRKEGISVTFGRSPGDLAAFYRVFAHNMRDLGTPVYGIEFFRAILDSWGEQVTIAVARLGKQPVGGAILLRYRETMEVPWASSLRAFHSAGVNMYLYREVLRHAIEGGCVWFDFGRSTEDGGTFRFKAQWGARPVRQHWLYSLPSGRELPGLRPDNPRFRLAIEAWKRLPVPITKLLGPRIIRKIP
jgi:serine/alanine adding enzyme